MSVLAPFARMVTAGIVALSLSAAAAAQELLPVKIGYVPAASAAPLLSPNAAAIFEKYGLKLELSQVNSGAAAVPLLLNGQLDFTISDPAAVILAVKQGVPVGIAAGLVVCPPEPERDYTAIIVRADSPLQSAADLSGKTMGIFGLNGLAHVLSLAAIDNLGGASGDVKFASVPLPQVVQTLEGGSIDAGFIVEPFLTPAVEEGKVRILINPYAAAQPGTPQALYISSRSVIETKPDTFEKFVAAANELNLSVRNSKEELVAGLRAVGNLSDEVIAKMRLPNFPADENEALAGLQGVIDYMVKYKVLDEQIAIEQVVLSSTGQ